MPGCPTYSSPQHEAVPEAGDRVCGKEWCDNTMRSVDVQGRQIVINIYGETAQRRWEWILECQARKVLCFLQNAQNQLERWQVATIICHFNNVNDLHN